MSDAQLNRKELWFLLLKEISKEMGHTASSRIRQEVYNIIRNYNELLRLIEFAYVASLSLHKSLRSEKQQLKMLAEHMNNLAVVIRAAINWTPLHAKKSRAQLLRAYFEQAQLAVRELCGYRGILTDEKTLRSQF